jgi:threonylcarbamoyladenosine tRNA methylthiotransferase MtaB
MASSLPLPRASIHTVGCRLNQAESAVLTDRLKQNGYHVVGPEEPTDLLVLNTCSVTEHAESDCRYLIRQTLRRSPAAFVAVTGCYAQTGVDALRRMAGVDLIVGAQFKMSLPDLLPDAGALRKRPAPEVLHSKKLGRDDFVIDGVGGASCVRANLKVQDGCQFMCSFCLIPFARGPERSRRWDDAVREAEALAARGHRELVLTGVNLGRYEQEGRSILDLIKRLETIEEVDRIRISSIEPTTISEALIEHMAGSRKLCRHLHVPLQSGDDDILRAMNRRYSVREYAAFVERAVRLIPEVGLGTDLLVGFPGETDSQFSNTAAVAAGLPFSYFHVFSYSARPGTAAARMPDQVADATITSRSRTLAGLSRAKRLTFYQRHIGRTVPVLFETEDDAGQWTGLTDNYVRVGLRVQQPLRNTLRNVTITGVMDGLAFGRPCDLPVVL